MDISTLYTKVLPSSITGASDSQAIDPEALRLLIYKLLHIFWIVFSCFSLVFIYFCIFGFLVGIIAEVDFTAAAPEEETDTDAKAPEEKGKSDT